MENTKSSVIQIQKPIKAELERGQKTFNRLKKKIETLQKNLQEINRDLDECLLFYHAYLSPAEKSLVGTLTQFVKMMYGFYKNPGGLSAEKLQRLKTWILNEVDKVLNLATFSMEIDPEIKNIFRDLEGVSYEEIVSEQLNSFKNEMQEILKRNGIEVDLSSIHIDGHQHDIMRKLFESFNIAQDDQPPSKPKTKKQLQKELRERQLEEAYKKGLGTIYKQLARAFHPDLEQDCVQKAEKEERMKKLTTAYKDGDLYTLLSLELEWMNDSNHQPTQKTHEQLKIYNSILKEQIETLQESIKMARLHPKYLPIDRFFHDRMFGLVFLKIAYHEIKMQEQEVQGIMERLQSPQAMKILRTILSQGEGKEEQLLKKIFQGSK